MQSAAVKVYTYVEHFRTPGELVLSALVMQLMWQFNE